MFYTGCLELTSAFVSTHFLPSPVFSSSLFLLLQLHLSAFYNSSGTDLSSFASVSVSKSKL